MVKRLIQVALQLQLLFWHLRRHLRKNCLGVWIHSNLHVLFTHYTCHKQCNYNHTCYVYLTTRFSQPLYKPFHCQPQQLPSQLQCRRGLRWHYHFAAKSCPKQQRGADSSWSGKLCIWLLEIKIKMLILLVTGVSQCLKYCLPCLSPPPSPT